MDDVIIFCKSLEDPITHIKQVFDKLQEYNLKIQLDNSEFLTNEVEFLGHIVIPKEIQPNSSEIEAIKKFPLPKTTKAIKEFLSLTGYYRRFLSDYAKIAQPLTKKLRKDSTIDLNEKSYLSAFQQLKSCSANDPVLVYPDFEKIFTLTTYAPNYAIGSVLSQDNHPIAYYSRTLNSPEQNYSTMEKEILSIIQIC